MVEPTDAVMLILKQIQDTLSEHSKRFDRIDGRFDKMDRRMDEMHDSTITALGLAGHANIRHDGVNDRLEDLTRRIERLEQAK